ncbi:MAG: hypothetical protein KAH38_08980, partial [Candidatus Hydrogenedentes bacterium]|nr:hypothetical protein [Candidatus Hydrogenedentota bacterium]
QGSEKKTHTIDIEKGENLLHFFQEFVECSRNNDPNTSSPIQLAYNVQTALIMSYLSLREGKVVHFDHEKETLVL